MIIHSDWWQLMAFGGNWWQFLETEACTDGQFQLISRYRAWKKRKIDLNLFTGGNLTTLHPQYHMHGWKQEAMLHSPNVILGSVLAVKKWENGICPKVMYRMYLGLIQMWRKDGFWISPNVLSLVQVVSGIAPN